MRHPPLRSVINFITLLTSANISAEYLSGIEKQMESMWPLFLFEDDEKCSPSTERIVL